MKPDSIDGRVMVYIKFILIYRESISSDRDLILFLLTKKIVVTILPNKLASINNMNIFTMKYNDGIDVAAITGQIKR